MRKVSLGFPTRADTNRTVHPQNHSLKFAIVEVERLYNICSKTKALISRGVTAQPICVFVFAHAKSRFSCDGAHITIKQNGS